MRRGARSATNGISVVRWHPPSGYALPLEVMRVADLRRRGSAEHFNQPQRVEFFMLMAVTRGPARHTIDFEPLELRAGDWLFLRPGQMQRFDFSRAWEGWVLVFVPDFLPPAQRKQPEPLYRLAGQLDEFPAAIRLASSEHRRCCAFVAQIGADASLHADRGDLIDLMLYQLCSLLARLRLRGIAGGGRKWASSADALRVTRLRKLVDENYRNRHAQAWYAAKLACSGKTLARAVRALAGTTLKAMVDERLALEAKRLLSYSREPVKAIADGLGFDEPGNFAKFFRRRTGCTPTRFRQTQALPKARA